MRSIQCLLAIFIAFASTACAQVGTIQPGTYVTFESPSVGSGYSYNPAVTVLNPFSFGSNQGGIAGGGSPFTPGTPSDPPSPNQFAYIQTNNALVSNMSTTLNGLTIGSTYTVEFAYSTRYDQGTQFATFSQLTVFLGANTLWASPQNITVQGGWVPVTFTFVATVTSAPFIFQSKAVAVADRSILIDSVSVQPAGFNPSSFSIPFGTVYSFENPSTNGSTYGAGLTMQPYYYNPGTSAQQPFTWSTAMGGVSLLGSPFDPPAPTALPDGSRQYAYLQTSPNGALNRRSNYLNSSFSGLTVGSSYSVSFYWSVRSGSSAGHNVGWATETQLTVRVGNNAVFVSGQNLTAIAGWYRNTTSSFVATAAVMPLSFNIVSLTDHDHTILFDAISIQLAGSSSTGPAVTSSSSAAALSSSSVSALSSSSAVPVGAASSSSVVLLASSSPAPAATSSARSSSSSAASSSSSSAASSSAVSSSAASSSLAASSPAAFATSSSRQSSSSSAASSTVAPVASSSSAFQPTGIVGGNNTSSSSAGFSTAAANMSSSTIVDTTTSSQIDLPNDNSLNGAQSVSVSSAVMLISLIACGMMMVL